MMQIPSRVPNYPFWRSTGLGLPSFLVQKFRKVSKHEEPKKAVVVRSFTTAASRCGVHLLPTMVSVVIITLNLKQVFLGRTLPGSLNETLNMALLQVAAKMQEMLIVASLAALVMQVIRDDMIHGDGIPLGLVGSGFLFSSLSYFWSPDFWGSFGSQSRVWRKLRLYSLLSLAGLIAAFAGPACAILLIPRVQEWDAGGSEFYLENSSDQLWPNAMTFFPNGTDSFCALPNATNLAGCPSGGYAALRDWVQGILYGASNTASNQDESIYNCQRYYTFRGSHAIIPDTVMTGNTRSRSCETSLSAVHLATAITQGQLARDWDSVVLDKAYTPTELTGSEYKYWTSLRVSTLSRIPVVRVACSEIQNLSTSQTSVLFPVLPEFTCWNSFEATEVFNQTTLPSTSLRTTWIDLPQQFGSVSTGLIVELPWVNNNTTRNVVGCSVDARWTKGIVSQSLIFNDENTSFGGPDFVGGAVSNAVDSIPCSAAGNWSAFTPKPDTSWSQINIDQSWLDVLVPPVPESADGSTVANQTTLEVLLTNSILAGALNDNINIRMQILNDADNVNKTVFLELLIAALVADGLSREGSVRLFDDNAFSSNWTLTNYNMTSDFDTEILYGGRALQAPPKSSNYTTLSAQITISGFCFKASEASDYLSVAVLLLHIILALIHTTWLLATGKSSSCWDTISELIALVQNSRPAPVALKNTCAGIKRLDTFSRLAKIRATKEVDDPRKADHVELLFALDHSDASHQQKRPSHSLTTSEHGSISQIELVSSRDQEEDASVYVPCFTSSLTDECSDRVFDTRRGRGSSSVSIPDSQRSLLRAASTHDNGHRRRRSAVSSIVLEKIQVGEEYGHSLRSRP